MPIDPRMVKWDEAPKIDARMVAWEENAPQEFAQTPQEILRAMPWGQRQLVGAGATVQNLWEGIKQFAGKADPKEIELARIAEREAPIGAFAGNALTAAVPFGMAGSGLKAAGLVGAGLGALQPVEGEQTPANIAQGKALNTAIGGAAGAGGQWVANKAGQMLANKAAQLAAEKSRNAPLDATIKEALDAGYTIPPGNVKPTFLNRQLESVGGKIATQQMASTRNQQITDALARKAATLGENEPITPNTIKAAFERAAMPFKEFANLGKLDAMGTALPETVKVTTKRGFDGLPVAQTANAQDVLQAWKQSNANARMYFAAYGRDLNPETLVKAQNAKQQAEGLFGYMETQAAKLGKPELAEALKQARVQYAKIGNVEDALIEGGGTLDARAIGRLAQKGQPLTGELATIGNFANNFPRITQPDKMIGTPDAHNLRYALSLALGGGGAAAGEDPRYAALGLLPLLSGPAARAAMFSGPMQSGLLGSYTLGLPARVGGGLLQYAPVGTTALGLQTLGQ